MGENRREVYRSAIYVPFSHSILRFDMYILEDSPRRDSPFNFSISIQFVDKNISSMAATSPKERNSFVILWSLYMICSKINWFSDHIPVIVDQIDGIGVTGMIRSVRRDPVFGDTRVRTFRALKTTEDFINRHITFVRLRLSNTTSNNNDGNSSRRQSQDGDHDRGFHWYRLLAIMIIVLASVERLLCQVMML